MPLSDSRIRNAKTKDLPYKITDAKGLYIEVRPTGSKLWRYRYKLKEKPKLEDSSAEAGPYREYLYALGEYAKARDRETPEQADARKRAGQFTLEEARQERIRLRGLVKQGIHPITHKRAHIASNHAAAGNTFEALALEWLAKMKPHWSAGHSNQAERTLKADVFPTVGSLPIRDVTARMIGNIMEAVANGTAKRDGRKKGAPTIAINIRQWCSAIFAHAVTRDAADGDPTTVLKGRVKRKLVKHKTPLSPVQISEMVKKVETAGAYPETKIALKLLLLLFVRPAEIRQGEWREFDLDEAEWVIPAAKMKKRDRHVVPLPSQAVARLRELKQLTGGQRWLFPNHRKPKQCMAHTTLNHALQRIGYKNQFTAHGFRATASTLLHGMGFDPKLIEFQLAHAERNRTAASYNQYQWIKERRQMMQQWSDSIDVWIAEGTDKVAPIKKRAA